MSNNEVADGFAVLLRRAEREREQLTKEVIHHYEELKQNRDLSDSLVFSVGPPCVLVADEDPVAWIDLDNRAHPISIHFELDESLIDENRFPALGALAGVVPSVPLSLSSRSSLLRVIPLRHNVAPLPPGGALPDVVSIIWNDFEELWRSCEYSNDDQIKLSVAKVLDLFFRELLEGVDGDTRRFEEQIREQRRDFSNAFDQLLAAALRRMENNEGDGEDVGWGGDDDTLILECEREPISEVQEAAAEFIKAAFGNLKDYIDNFESDVGDFPFLVQQNEKEALFKLDEDGEVCFLREGFDIPTELLDQDVDGFISLEAPGDIGYLRFIPMFGSWQEIRESATQLIDDDGLDLIAFGELEAEERRQVSLIWSIVTSPNREEALDDLKIHKDEIETVDEPAFVPGNGGMTPLMQAAAHQSKDLLELLLRLGADPSRRDSAGFSPLTYSLQGENLENFSLLLEKGSGVDPVPSSQGTYSPLAMACDHGLLPAVKALIQQGADVNWRSAAGATAIKYAAAGGHADCLRSVLDAGGAAAAYDSEGFSPIHNAADSGSVEALSVLLSAGVDVDLPIRAPSDDAGRTALNRAGAFGNREAVEYLLDKGASANRVFNDGATCLSSTLVHAEVVDADREAILQALLDHDALAGVGAMPAGMFLLLVLQKMRTEWVSRIFERLNRDLAGVCGQGEVDKLKAITNAVVKKWFQEETSANRRGKVLAALKSLDIEWLTIDNTDETEEEPFSEIESNSAEAVLLCLAPMAIASVHEQQDPKALLEEISQYRQRILPAINRLVRRLVEDDEIRGVLQAVEMMVGEAAPLLEGLPAVHVDLDSKKMSANLISVFKSLANKSSDEQREFLKALCSKITAGALKILIVEVMGVAMLRDEKVTEDEKRVLLTVLQALGMEERIQEIVNGETSEGYAVVKTLIFESTDVSELLFGASS